MISRCPKRVLGALFVCSLGAADLGRCFGADLTEREVDWLIRTEWARTAADVLWRRSKLGLRLTANEVGALHEYLAHQAISGG